MIPRPLRSEKSYDTPLGQKNPRRSAVLEMSKRIPRGTREIVLFVRHMVYSIFESGTVFYELETALHHDARRRIDIFLLFPHDTCVTIVACTIECECLLILLVGIEIGRLFTSTDELIDTDSLGFSLHSDRIELTDDVDITYRLTSRMRDDDMDSVFLPCPLES